MKSLRVAVVVITGLVVALWWAAMPPAFPPKVERPVEASKQLQCPANSRLDGKLCVCDSGTVWTGHACSARSEPALAPAGVREPPLPGSVAMLGAGQLAIVETVSATSVTIIEGNYEHGSLTRRSARGRNADEAARKLGIVSYEKR